MMILYEVIVATNAHVALDDDKKIINLQLQALQLWYEIWGNEATVEQQN
jgi:hypothetical protein